MSAVGAMNKWRGIVWPLDGVDCENLFRDEDPFDEVMREVSLAITGVLLGESLMGDRSPVVPVGCSWCGWTSACCWDSDTGACCPMCGRP